MEENVKYGIKQWAEEDRPREKLLLKGKSALSDAELLAILVASGNDEETAVDLCKRILQAVNNNLLELSKLSVGDLKKFRGIGDAKALSIIAALELGKRRRAAEALVKPIIHSSRQLFEVAQNYLSDLPHEEFLLICMKRNLALISAEIISRGGQVGTVVDPKIVLKMAIEKMACYVAVAHNHPSGNLQPSADDLKITKKLKAAFELVGIQLTDHLIVGENTYYSMCDEGILDNRF